MKYEEFNIKSGDEKSVWHHFLRATDKQSAQCKKCKKILKCTGGSTTGLHSHLRSAHILILDDAKFREPSPISSKSEGTSQSQETEGPPLKKSKLTDYFQFQSNNNIETRASRMVCLDGIPFSKFCTSTDLRELFSNSNLILPRSPNSIKKLVIEYAVKIQQELRVMITNLKAKGFKFSLTFDEWTSSKNRRFMNVNIHSEDLGKNTFRSVALIRINGSMPAEKCIALLDKRLSLYNISLYKDIVGITTDGVSVMVKVGKKLNLFHQLCFAHGIQLAVLDVLYKKVTTASTTETDTNEMELLLVSDSAGESGENSDSEEDGGFEIVHHVAETNDLRDQDIRGVIEKVRSVVKIFRNSATKNDDILQKYVKEDFNKELCMKLDCKTRWSSMADMLTRFLELKYCISKSLIDLKSNITYSEKDFQILRSIGKCLDVVKTTVEVLCRREANLLTAETAMKFMIRKLEEQKTVLSADLADALKNRTRQRRTLASSIMMYLHNPKEYYKFDGDTTFIKHSAEEITIGLISLHRQHNETDKEEISVANDNDNSIENIELTVAEELEKELQKYLASEIIERPQNEHENYIKNVISVEMVLYENGGNRGRYLEEAYKYLSSIPPTSVEAERAFSSAGYICSDIRSSLNDSTLDALCFLRTYFQQQKFN